MNYSQNFGKFNLDLTESYHYTATVLNLKELERTVIYGNDGIGDFSADVAKAHELLSPAVHDALSVFLNRHCALRLHVERKA